MSEITELIGGPLDGMQIRKPDKGLDFVELPTDVAGAAPAGYKSFIGPLVVRGRRASKTAIYRRTPWAGVGRKGWRWVWEGVRSW